MDFPEPVISIAIEPKTKSDQEKLAMALSRMSMEDPSFKVHTDRNTGDTLISGMGELHLEIIVDRIRREFGVEANVGRPQVAYTESITREAQEETKYAKQTGGHGQFAHVLIRWSPSERLRLRIRRQDRGALFPASIYRLSEKGSKRPCRWAPARGTRCRTSA